MFMKAESLDLNDGECSAWNKIFRITNVPQNVGRGILKVTVDVNYNSNKT